MIAQRFVSTNPQANLGVSGYARVPQQVSALTRKPSGAELERMIWHPSYGSIVYPKNPDRTVNYFKSVVRGYDINSTKTLSSNILIRDHQKFEEITVTEIWLGGGKALSEESQFLDTLNLILNTETALGRYVGWIPKDLNFQRHKILPMSLTVGGRAFDAREIRSRMNSSRDSYIDKTIEFTFRLIRPVVFLDGLLLAEGV